MEVTMAHETDPKEEESNEMSLQEPITWICPVCAMENQMQEQEICTVCHRARKPAWLQVANKQVQEAGGTILTAMD